MRDPERTADRRVAALFVACSAAVCASLAWRELPASVDYPQHLALAGQIRDLVLGHGEGRLVVFTDNGLFHLLTAAASLVVPLEVAGRAMLATSVGLSAFAVWRLVRFCERPAAYAFAWLPFAYGLPLSWGFFNFQLSIALATLALIHWWKRGPSGVFVALSLATAIAHVLGGGLLIVGSALGVGLRARPMRALASVVPCAAWLGAAHLSCDPAPHLAWGNQIFWPEWSERLSLGRALLGALSGPADEWLATGTGALVAIGLLVAALRTRRWPWPDRRQPFAWLTLSAVFTYALGPAALFGCWYFFQRAGYVAVLWLPALLPAAKLGRWSNAFGLGLVALGVTAAANFVAHQLDDGETADAQAILAAIPQGARVVPVLDLGPGQGPWHALRGQPVTDRVTWGHFPAYAIAARGAEIPWMFAREHGHFPLRQAPAPDLGFPPVDYSWIRQFDPEAAYARVFHHVLVRSSSSDPQHDPKEAVLGAAATSAVELAHHGHFWLYELPPRKGSRVSAVARPRESDSEEGVLRCRGSF